MRSSGVSGRVMGAWAFVFAGVLAGNAAGQTGEADTAKTKADQEKNAQIKKPAAGEGENGGKKEAKKRAPTFSLEVVAINSIPLPGGPVREVKIAPGNTLTAEILLRDWSPNGEQLRSYQAEIDSESYRSGESGTVRPIRFDNPPPPGEDSPHVYINKNDPRYVHRDLDGITITDVHSAPGYRWLNVLINGPEAPVCPQDGTKYYLGTLELVASDDAKGTFEIKFTEGEERTGLRNPFNEPIVPVEYESMKVEVKPEYARMVLRESVPANGHVDARLPEGKGGTKNVQLLFLADAGKVKAEELEVADGTENPPQVTGVAANGSVVRVTLSPGLTAGRWTKITYKPTDSSVRIGYLPGDVTGDGVTDADDVRALLDVLSARRTLPPARTDMNRDEVVTSSDVMDLLEYLTPEFSKRQAPLKMRD